MGWFPGTGEIVCPDKRQFAIPKPVICRAEPRFYALDLLSAMARTCAVSPLIDRKHRLRGVVAHKAERLFYVRTSSGSGLAIPIGTTRMLVL